MPAAPAPAPRPAPAPGARPLVALTGWPVAAGDIRGWRDPAAALHVTYLEALRRAGAHPVVVGPWPLDPADAPGLLARFDGLVLTGGADVDPARYGAEPHPSVYGTDPVRDDLEVALLRAALDAGVPVLAICRGLQVVNVALGGTLDQHITGRPGLVGHGTPGIGADPDVHPVDVVPGSFLADRLGRTHLRACSSHHHQAVADLAGDLVATAHAPDGIVEGVDLPGARLLAVQWHPEDTAADDPEQQRCFDALVEEIVA